MKKEKKRKNQVRTCCAVVRQSGVRCYVGHIDRTRRPSLARRARDERPRNWRLATLVDRTPQKLKGEREYHEIQKRKLLGIVGN